MNVRKLVKRIIPQKLFQSVEPYGHWAEAIVFNVIYGFPARGMKVVGVTGTNGKTTTSYLIHRMLTEAGYSVGLMTTVAYGVNDDIRPQHNHMTTVPAPLLMRRLKWMRDKGADWIVLETTSHALAQRRVWGIPYSIAVFTNLSHEHLDYHKTFERYRSAKVRLFKLAAANHHGLQTGIVNSDDPNWRYFARAVPHVIRYGIHGGDMRATDIHATPLGSDFTVSFKKRDIKVHTNLPGSFNISNALAAIATGYVIGLSDEQISSGIAALKVVEGRMETIDEGQPFTVVVDFAVTPDALAKSLQTLKETATGRVLLVFGATGDRDKSKRPEMGKVAVNSADLIFLTDDETYTEDPETIREAVYRGIVAAGGETKTTIIADRRVAISTAFNAARKGDTVLLAGMGHLTTRNMGGSEIGWDEREIARKLLKNQKPLA